MSRWMQNKPFSFRVYMLAGGALLGLIAIVILGLVISTTVQNSRDRADYFNSISMMQKDLENYSLQMRRKEKDFFIRQEIKYADGYYEEVAHAQSVVKKLLDSEVSSEFHSAVKALNDILPRHAKQFDVVKEDYVQLGLDENAGLQGQLRDAVHEIENILSEYKSDKLEILMLMMRRHEKDFIMRVDEKYIGRMNDRSKEFQDSLMKEDIAASAKEEILTNLNTYISTFNAYAKLRLQLDDNTKKLSDIYAETTEPFEIISKASQDGTIAAEQAAEDTEQVGFIATMGVGFVIILLVSLLSALIIRITIAPVKSLENALQKIAAGDFKVAIPGAENKDEFGRMAHVTAELRDSAAERVRLEAEARTHAERQAALEKREIELQAEREREEREREKEQLRIREERNQMIGKLIAEFEKSISIAISNLSQSSSKMRETATGMVSVADTTSRQVESVSNESHQMQDNVTSMASAIEEFAASIAEVSQQMQRASSNSREAMSAAKDGQAAIEKLSDASSQIEGVVKLINDISEQTNLLALNATIEAARAGEAGKGFAVVASEVKALANQTAKAIEGITSQIVAIQNVTGSTVNAMDSISGANDRLNQVMSSIAAAVEEQEVTTNDISRGVQFAAEGTRRVASDILVVTEGAKKTGSASNSVMEEANKLDGLSSSLRIEVETFLGQERTL
ncbi:methyl-accepting chemotaxis protein [Kordiimonas pumila]|uniref:Methyl-accepting chemotaxis protein n=1 Tax=Kordiimonas pumila TaxID=2161677 RepID=A0ABV7D892_9PROT|nr:methyl-accepting chemotaxis protein [Kordiimonas pumila]